MPDASGNPRGSAAWHGDVGDLHVPREFVDRFGQLEKAMDPANFTGPIFPPGRGEGLALFRATVTLTVLNGSLTIVALVSLFLASRAGDYAQAILLELGADAVLFVAVALGTPRLSREGTIRTATLFVILPALAVALLLAAWKVESDYLQALLIEFGAAIVIFVVLETIFKSIADALEHVRQEARAMLALLENAEGG